MKPALPDVPLFLHGDYEYLSEGYYACQDAEAQGLHPHPSCADTLDAYVVPLALERVSQAGLPVPTWFLTNEYFTPPAVLYGINPFARTHLVVRTPDERDEAARKISRSGKYVICCQELPKEAELVTFEMVLDRTPDVRYAAWADALFELFHLPLAKVRLIATSYALLFSAIERLPRTALSDAARALLPVAPHG